MLLLCMPIWCVAVGYTPSSGVYESPAVSMRSTSAYLNPSGSMQYSSQSATTYGGFRTSASAVRGGVTTYDAETSSQRNANARKFSPGVPGFPTPIDFDWMAGLFMALLAAAYAFYKTRRKNVYLQIITSVLIFNKKRAELTISIS